jgi:hypothetical protein
VYTQVVSTSLSLLLLCACRAGVELSEVEVKYSNLEISADVNVGSRGMPTVANAFINTPLVGVFNPWVLSPLSLVTSHPSHRCVCWHVQL